MKFDNHYNKFLLRENDNIFREENLTEVASQDKNLVRELVMLGLLNQERPQLSSTKLQEYYEFCPAFRKFIQKNSSRIVRVHDSIEISSDFQSQMQTGLVYRYETEDRAYLICNNEENIVTQRIALSEKIKTADDFYGTYGPTTIRGDWWSGFYLDMGNVSKEGDVVYNNGKKPLRLIKQLIEFLTKENDIVMDFFSGSATTAHAVLEVSRLLGRRQRFIAVQLNEELNAKIMTCSAENKKVLLEARSFLRKNNLPLIHSEIGKERIRRAGEKIKQEIEAENAQLKTGEDPKKVPDIGFKVFKLDSSNLKKWQPDYDDFNQSLLDSIDNYVDGRTELDVVYEIMLKMGLELTYPLETCAVKEKNIYVIAYGALMICLDHEITTDVAHEMIRLHEEYQPEIWQVVFKDNGFASDSVKTNIKEMLKVAGLDEDAFTTI